MSVPQDVRERCFVCLYMWKMKFYCIIDFFKGLLKKCSIIEITAMKPLKDEKKASFDRLSA